MSLIDTKEELSKFRTLVYDGIKKVQSERGLPASLKVFSDWQRLWESKQIDVLFRNAPHLLIASAPSSISSPEADSHITLSYFELLANTNGIGTLWNGLLKMVMQAITPDLVSVLGIPNDHVIGYFMVFGLPKVKYARAVQSEGLHLNRIHL